MKPLRLEPPPFRDPSIPEEIWRLPERIRDLGLQHGKTREEIAAMAGRNPSALTHWFRYEGLMKLGVDAIVGIEKGFGLLPGTLLANRPISGNVRDATRVADTGLALGLDESVVRAMLDGSGETMTVEFGEELKRAVLGAVHVLGYSLEDAVAAARVAASRIGARTPLTAESWLGELRAHLPKKPGSGTFPSSGKIKLL